MDPSPLTPVLIASSDAGTRAQVLLTLGDERYVAHEAAHTDEALRVVAELLPPVVILDVALAGAGAAAVARSLRQQPETSRLRILLLTRRPPPRPDGVDGPDGPAGVAGPVSGVADVSGVSGVDATLVGPFTAFSLLRRVDALVAGPA